MSCNEVMDESSENNFLDGDIVWVKLGPAWWPGEVVGSEKLPPDILTSFKKPPYAVVKFFQEDTYEYVKTVSNIFKYNCSRKDEFIKKGMDKHRAKLSIMEKFPEDIKKAEILTNGDPDILDRDDFHQSTKKESYAGLFGDTPRKSPLNKKGKGKHSITPKSAQNTPNRRPIKRNPDYKAHILIQGKSESSSEALSPPPQQIETVTTPSSITPPHSNPNSSSGPGLYSCHACHFTTTRINVLVLHTKSHSSGAFIPYTPKIIKPSSTPKKNKPIKTVAFATPIKETKTNNVAKRGRRRKGDDTQSAGSKQEKRQKTDEEIKSTLLADWSEEEGSDSEINSESESKKEIPEEDLENSQPSTSKLNIEIDTEKLSETVESIENGKEDVVSESNGTEEKHDKLESKSCFDFQEDEELTKEKDVGWKIPRVKSDSESKSTKTDVDFAKEVADLLEQTAVPDLPAPPPPLPNITDQSPEKNLEKEENFPKREAEGAPPPKIIFKTKTFFRSRHSRSQDAIEKYVAEQLKADHATTNGSETSLLEEIVSPACEIVKVAKLAPKIQLKKMKAEAQLRESEITKTDNIQEIIEDIHKVEQTGEFVLKSTEEEFSEVESTSEKSHNIETEADSQNSEELAETCINKTEIQGEKTIKDKKKSITQVEGIDEENTENEMVTENISPTKEVINSPEKLHLQTMQKSPTKSPAKENPNNSHENKTLQKEKHHRVKTPTKKTEEIDTLERHHYKSPSKFPKEQFIVIKGSDPSVKGSEEQPNVLIVLGNTQKSKQSITEQILKHSKISPNKLNVESSFTKPEEVVLSQDGKTPDENEKNNSKNEQTEISETITPSAVDALLSISKANVMHSKISEDPPDDIFADDTKTSENMHSFSFYEGKQEVQNNNVVYDHCKQKSSELNRPCPSESDLQIAETLLNLPSTVQNNNQEVMDNDLVEETVEISETVVETTPTETKNENEDNETETSKNLNAAESLVQMSVSMDFISKSNSVNIPLSSSSTPNVVNKDEHLPKKMKSTIITTTSEQTPSKLMKILEEPVIKPKSPYKIFTSVKKEGEKILNFDTNKKTQINKMLTTPHTQKIIIRRATPSGKAFVESKSSNEKIILSRSNTTVSKEGNSVSTYTLETKSDGKIDPNTIIIQQKPRKIITATTIQQVKPQSTIITSTGALVQQTTSKDMFDISSMPIVLSDEILTPETIEKMPVILSDGSIITEKIEKSSIQKTTKRPAPKIVESSASPAKKTPPKIIIKSETRVAPQQTLVKQTNTPNILSKTNNMKTGPSTVTVDNTGGRKIIITKADVNRKSETVVKSPVVKLQSPKPNLTPHTPTKNEKFIILPAAAAGNRTQKLVVNPTTGKSQLILPRSAITPVKQDAPAETGKIMIITNAQGAKSRLILTPEHEKLLFPQKNIAQTNVNTTPIIRTIEKSSKPNIISKSKPVAPVAKQLCPAPTTIRVSRASTNIAPYKTQKPVKKAPQKEPIIILQQKTGPNIQLTQAQFEYLQKTGQIVQKGAKKPIESKSIIKKSTVSKPAIAPSPTMTLTPVPTQNIITRTIPNQNQQMTQNILLQTSSSSFLIQNSPNVMEHVETSNVATINNKIEPISSQIKSFETPAPQVKPTVTAQQTDLDNLEELLPCTAIARPQEVNEIELPQTVDQEVPLDAPPSEANPQPNLGDGQLLAVPGENFGGPPDSFYLCVDENGTLTPIDERPLILENNQLVPMTLPWPGPAPAQAPPRDILAAALANTDVFPGNTDAAPDFRDLNANVAVHCHVSETSTTLNNPIMSTLEVPTSLADGPPPAADLETVLGVSTPNVPTSLDLPITVTDPRIAAAPISMPILDDCLPKSMPILSDVTDANDLKVDIHSHEIGHSESILMTPGSVSSEEIPLPPTIAATNQPLPTLDVTSDLIS